MIRIENPVFPSPDQMDAVIRGMRNPLCSWDKTDTADGVVGANDMQLMQRLGAEGSPCRKYMRMLVVYVDITAPLYWWKEFDTYKIGTVANSCSTMHYIHKRNFSFDDFSIDHLTPESKNVLNSTIHALNENRGKFLETSNKDYWWQMIQLLPSSYNQKRTVMINYEVLWQMIVWRRKHKLDEWREFVEWIRTVPYAEQLLPI